MSFIRRSCTVLGLIIAISIGFGAGSYLFFRIDDRLAGAASFLGFPVGGLSSAQMNPLFDLIDERLGNHLIRVASHMADGSTTAGDGGEVRTWIINPRKLGLRLDRAAAIDEIRAGHDRLGRSGSDTGGPILPVILDEIQLNAELARIGEEVYQPPKNARLDTWKGTVLPGETGRKLDVEKTAELIINSYRTLGEREILLPFKMIESATTEAELRLIWSSGLKSLTRYSTWYDSSQTERAHNIYVAACALDGTVLQPGEELSFNSAVGPRREDRGFKPAPEIYQNELVTGIGGGICQVSTTLYNAALLADLEILERRNHSILPAYAIPGRDATVSYGLIDLRIANNLEAPVVIRSEARDGRVTVEVLSSAPSKGAVDLEVRTGDIPAQKLETAIQNSSGADPVSPPASDDGPAEPPGMYAQVWKVYKDASGDNASRKVFLYTDYYLSPPVPSSRKSDAEGVNELQSRESAPDAHSLTTPGH